MFLCLFMLPYLYTTIALAISFHVFAIISVRRQQLLHLFYLNNIQNSSENVLLLFSIKCLEILPVQTCCECTKQRMMQTYRQLKGDKFLHKWQQIQNGKVFVDFNKIILFLTFNVSFLVTTLGLDYFLPRNADLQTQKISTSTHCMNFNNSS